MLHRFSSSANTLITEPSTLLHNKDYNISAINNCNHPNNYTNRLDRLRDKFDEQLKRFTTKSTKRMDENTIKLLGISFRRENIKTAAAFFAAGAVGAHLIGRVVRAAAMAGTASYLTLYYLNKYGFISIHWDKVNEESDALMTDTKQYIQDQLKDDSLMTKISRFINNSDNAIYVLSVFGGILFGIIFL